MVLTTGPALAAMEEYLASEIRRKNRVRAPFQDMDNSGASQEQEIIENHGFTRMPYQYTNYFICGAI